MTRDELAQQIKLARLSPTIRASAMSVEGEAIVALADRLDRALALLRRWTESSVTPSSELDVTSRALLAEVDAP